MDDQGGQYAHLLHDGAHLAHRQAGLHSKAFLHGNAGRLAACASLRVEDYDLVVR